MKRHEITMILYKVASLTVDGEAPMNTQHRQASSIWLGRQLHDIGDVELVVSIKVRLSLHQV
jgi:hypothetical protein